MDQVEQGLAEGTAPVGGEGKGRGLALGTLAVLALVYTLYFAAPVILPLLIALILNLLLQPARRLLCRRLRLPGPLAALLLIVLLFGIAGSVVAAISLPATRWVARAPEALPALQDKLRALGPAVHAVQAGLDRITQALAALHQQNAGQETVRVAQGSPLPGIGLTILQSTQIVVGQVLTVVVLLFFLLSAGDTLLRRIVEVVPRFTDKRRVVEIADTIEENVSGYLLTITVMNVAVGAANGISAWACGLPDPLLWGVLAFLLNYIPLIGPITGAVTFFIVGVFTYPDLLSALLPAGIYLAIHVVEGQTVTPMLVASRFTLNPVILIAWFFFWFWLWGVLGALLATPLLAIAKIVSDRVEPLQPLGHVLGGAPGRQR